MFYEACQHTPYSKRSTAYSVDAISTPYLQPVIHLGLFLVSLSGNRIKFKPNYQRSRGTCESSWKANHGILSRLLTSLKLDEPTALPQIYLWRLALDRLSVITAANCVEETVKPQLRYTFALVTLTSMQTWYGRHLNRIASSENVYWP